jgi:mannose-6-phosphate isomerase-like protein (cupin superfamily)
MRIRRVVTGHDERGHAVFASDEVVEPLTIGSMPGAEFHRLWGGDVAPTFPDDGSPPAQPMFFPPVGGYRFAFFSVAPAGIEPPGDLDPESAAAAIDAVLPGMTSHMEADEPGMHTTDTIDFEVVISGEVVLELDDGAETTLRAGDTVVQNGTRHRWSNRGSEPAVLAVFIVGANRR